MGNAITIPKINKCNAAKFADSLHPAAKGNFFFYINCFIAQNIYAKMKPQATVCMAAYGDYGPGYIGTQVAYSQGGYETSYVSRVAPVVEKVLTDATAELLK